MRKFVRFSILLFLAAAFLPAAQAQESDNYQKIESVFKNLYPDYSLKSKLSNSQNTSMLFQAESINSDCSNNFAVQHDLNEVKLEIRHDPRIIAYALATAKPVKLVISSGLVSKLDTESQLAFILAHEMAHLIQGHVSLDLEDILFTQKQLQHIHRTRQQWELDADSLAHSHLQKSGYSTDAIPEVLQILSNSSDRVTHKMHGLHPENARRLAAWKAAKLNY